MLSGIVALFFGYILLVSLLLWSWYRIFKGRRTLYGSGEIVTLSVVIPARNEAGHINSLLDDLAGQNVPAEIIVVDDRSDDDTPEIVQKRINRGQTNLRLIRLTHGGGKKSALAMGIAAATGNVIVATDADCRVGPAWLAVVRDEFQQPDTDFLFGGVRIQDHRSLWSSIEGMEFASLVGAGAALYGMGFPVMCNGANIAFRKNIFDEVGGYSGNQHIASGDDGYLFRKFFRRNDHGVRFCTNRGHVVTTKGTRSPKEFFSQRLRWSGKWRRQGKAAGVTAIVVFLFHLCFVAVNGWAIAQGLWKEALGLWSLKALIEYAFLKRVADFTRLRWNVAAFFILQMFYSSYVVIFGLLAQAGAPEWKGRRIRMLRLAIRE